MDQSITSRIFSVFLVILFGITVVVPLLMLIGSSFATETLNSIIEPGTLKPIFNSLLISFATAILTTATGTCFAFLLTKTNLPFAKLIALLFLLPLFLPPYIFAVAWSDLIIALGQRNLINSISGTVLILSFVYTPVALFIISASLINVHRSFEEAGQMTGSYSMVIRKIILPLILPALLSSFSLIFVLSISEFSVPSYFSVPVLSTHVFTEFTAFYNYAAAIGQSAILVLICLLVIYPASGFLSHESVWTMSKKAFDLKTIRLRAFSPWLFVCLVYLCLSEFLPIGYLIIQSFANGSAALVHAGGLLLPEIASSVLIAIEGALALLLFGYVFAKISVHGKWKIIDLVLLSVFAIPSTVIGIALIRFFNTPSLNFIYGSSSIVLIAYLARFAFISKQMCAICLKQIPDSFQEAALLVRATHYTRFVKIQFPLISEGLFNAFCICFLFCLSELGASIMVYPPGTSLLTVKVFTIMANSSQGLISAMSVIVLFVTLIVIAIIFVIRRFAFQNTWR